MIRDEASLGLRNATLHLGRRPFATPYANFEVHFFRDLAAERTAMAIVCGDLEGREPLLSRVHSSCLTSECLMGRDCDCAEQLEGALAMIARAGRGVVFYLMQEGRGAGLSAKARDRMIVQASGNQKTTFEAYAEMGLPADLRHYGELAPICGLLGIRGSLCLLTNNPEKATAVSKVLASEGIALSSIEQIQGPTSPFNRDYLGAKFDLGHSLDRPGTAIGALPPGTVDIFEPRPLVEGSTVALMASYFLPVGLPSNAAATAHDVEWFRSSVVFDPETARESIVLAWDAPVVRDAPSVSIAGPRITMSLRDRLPGASAAGRVSLVDALLGIRDREGGSVVVDFDDNVSSWRDDDSR
jgi:GTP cyclohydrolase II